MHRAVSLQGCESTGAKSVALSSYPSATGVFKGVWRNLSPSAGTKRSLVFARHLEVHFQDNEGVFHRIEEDNMRG
jgi:hypothetical protein